MLHESSEPQADSPGAEPARSSSVEDAIVAVCTELRQHPGAAGADIAELQRAVRGLCDAGYDEGLSVEALLARLKRAFDEHQLLGGESPARDVLRGRAVALTIAAC